MSDKKSKPSRIRAECKIKGFPRIRKGMTIDIQGDTAYNSKKNHYWYVVEVRHEYFEGVFTTYFEIETELLSKKQRDSKDNRNATYSYASTYGLDNMPVLSADIEWDTYKGMVPEVFNGESMHFYHVMLSGKHDLGDTTSKLEIKAKKHINGEP